MLRKDELAASKVSAGAIQKHRDLERKGQLAIQVAVKTIVVAGAISQQQRGRAGLPGVMTAFRKRENGRWERLRELKCVNPAICDFRERRTKVVSTFRDGGR